MSDLTADRDAIAAKMNVLRKVLADRDRLAKDVVAEDRNARLDVLEQAVAGLVRDLRAHIELVEILQTTSEYYPPEQGVER